MGGVSPSYGSLRKRLIGVNRRCGSPTCIRFDSMTVLALSVFENIHTVFIGTVTVTVRSGVRYHIPVRWHACIP